VWGERVMVFWGCVKKKNYFLIVVFNKKSTEVDYLKKQVVLIAEKKTSKIMKRIKTEPEKIFFKIIFSSALGWCMIFIFFPFQL
jgi:hypothetical protein